MATIDDNELKEFLKDVSRMISELASSLDHYVEDVSDETEKRAFKKQIHEAEEMADSLDDTIFKMVMQKFGQ